MFLTHASPVQYNFYVQKVFSSVLQTDDTNWLACIHPQRTEAAFLNSCPFIVFTAFRLRFDCSIRNNSRSPNCNHIFSSVHHWLTFIWFPCGTHHFNKCYLLVQLCQDHKSGNKCCSWDSHQINKPLNWAAAAQVQKVSCPMLECQAQKLKFLKEPVLLIASHSK